MAGGEIIMSHGRMKKERMIEHGKETGASVVKNLGIKRFLAKISTIVGGFAGGGASNSAEKAYIYMPDRRRIRRCSQERPMKFQKKESLGSRMTIMWGSLSSTVTLG